MSIEPDGVGDRNPVTPDVTETTSAPDATPGDKGSSPTRPGRGSSKLEKLADTTQSADHVNFKTSGGEDAADTPGGRRPTGRDTQNSVVGSTKDLQAIDQLIASMSSPSDLGRILNSLLILGVESEQPVKLKEAANRLAQLFNEQHCQFEDVDRIIAYNRLVDVTLALSVQAGAEDYAETFAAIAALAKHFHTTGGFQSDFPGRHLARLLAVKKDVSPANIGVAAKAAFEALDGAPEAVRGDVFRVAAGLLKALDSGRREPLLLVMAENIDNCPTSGVASAVPAVLITYSKGESSSCQSRVRDLVFGLALRRANRLN